MSARSPLPAAGLCSDCRNARLLASPRSTFVRCDLSDRDPRFERFPRLPVRECAGHEPRRPDGEGGAPAPPG